MMLRFSRRSCLVRALLAVGSSHAVEQVHSIPPRWRFGVGDTESPCVRPNHR